jgi:uncharacterized protein YbaR (Trm112 family)
VFIPLVDLLRCPNAHEETWLVASIERLEERDIIEGMLGCPQCLAEYRIRDGVVYFDETVVRAAAAPPSDTDATRIAATLDLTNPRMTAVLVGQAAAHAPLVRAIAPAQLILVNPPIGIASGDGISIIVASVPRFAQRSIDAAAVDASAAAPLLHAIGSALRGGGRLLAPTSTTMPPDFHELARDAEVWVAQLDAGAVTSAPVLPTRRARTENR